MSRQKLEIRISKSEKKRIKSEASEGDITSNHGSTSDSTGSTPFKGKGKGKKALTSALRNEGLLERAEREYHEQRKS